MRYFGVVYDVGLNYGGGWFSNEKFDPEIVRYDMRAIKNDLNANAIRIEGDDIERLRVAGRLAHEAGLAVWMAPWRMNVGEDATTAYLEEAALMAEQLRKDGADVTFILGCEYTIFSDGIYPGETFFDRSAWVKTKLDGWPQTPENLPEPLPEKAKELNRVLRSFSETVRKIFHGPQLYSAAIFEEVDWTIFDYAGPNNYRETQTDAEYQASFDYFKSFGRPVAVPEFGCCTYEGAADLGARGWRVLEGSNPDGTGKWKDGVLPVRSETEQADYIERQLRAFVEAGVEAAFVFMFADAARPVDEGTRDLDRATYSIVKWLPAHDPRSRSMPPWEPKESFTRTAALFGKLAAGERI